MTKKLRRFGEVPKGGLISYPDSKTGRLYHVLEHRGHTSGSAMSGIIAEHIPFDEVFQDGVRIRQSICSHAVGDPTCPDKVYHHDSCDCCGKNAVAEQLEYIRMDVSRSADILFDEIKAEGRKTRKLVKRRT